MHLVWTTYGTWLPGDPAKPGHWSPLFDVYGRLIRAGHRINLPDATTYDHARSLMKEEPKVLGAEERRIVAHILGSHIAPALAGVNAAQSLAPRSLPESPREVVRAFACAIEPTHVHLLVGPVREDIGRFVGRLKGTTSSALLQHPNNWGRNRIWTNGYWKVFLFDMEPLMIVQPYIESHNTRAGRPASPYSWLTPIQ
jgi:hypothetical protein